MGQKTTELRAMVDAFSRDIVSIGGLVPLERMLKKHPNLLPALRASGMTWIQLAELLHEAGIKSKTGHPISHHHWRSLASRTSRSANNPQRSESGLDSRRVIKPNIPRLADDAGNVSLTDENREQIKLLLSRTNKLRTASRK